MAGGTVTTHPRARSFIIKRPRLTKLLDDSGARILLLLAPAGYGKTTLAHEWLEGKDGVAWYSGGPAMADVAALAAGIADALTSAVGAETDLTERVQVLAARGQTGAALAKAISAADVTKSCMILAIDDCQHAANSEEATVFFSELLARTEFRVVATSRVRPQWVSPRMLVYGDATAIEVADLSFTDEEALEVLDSSPELQTRLLAEARGWPAVLALAARRNGMGVPSGDLGPADLYEFFADDLFGTASEDLRSALFLLALGADSRPDVMTEVLGSKHDRVLAEATEYGFLTASGSRTTLHPLLRDFLLSKLKALPKDEVDISVQRVANALAKRACWDECLGSLEAFPIAELITSTLDQALVELLAAGRVATVRRWLDLADATHAVDPILLLAEAELALRGGDDRKAQVFGERAGELFAVGDVAGRAYVVAARAAHLRDDRSDARAYGALAEGLATSVATRVEALWIQFGSAVEEHASEAESILDRMRQIEDERPDHALRLHNAAALLLLDFEGDARGAARECELAAGFLAHAHDPVLRTNFLNLHSHVMLVVGSYEQALERAGRQITDAEANGLDFAIDHALVHRAAALVGLRRLLEAQRAISELERRAQAAPGYILRNTNLQAARLSIAVGDLPRAEILLRRQAHASYRSSAEQLAYHGLVLAALGELSEADRILLEAREEARVFDAITMTDLGQAVLTLQQKGAEAHVFIHLLLRQAVDKGCADAIVTACRAHPELARVGAQDSQLARLLTEILLRSRDFDLGRRAGLEMPRELRRNEGLSPRELEVYELLVQGRTNGEIATTLYISESTAKVHVRHIFEKLGVHTRAEAARANPDRA